MLSRRILAPILLLLAAACSVAAVFAVHRIESRGGPLAEPSAVPRSFSPNGDGVQDEVRIAFATRSPERVTVDIVDGRGKHVARLMDGERVDGDVELTWDGAGARDGRYDAEITRAGDDRTYAPPRGILLDTRPPRGVLDRATLEAGTLRGLAMLFEGEDVVVMDAEARQTFRVRGFRPRDPDAESAQPVNEAPEGSRALRFTAEVGALPLASLAVFIEDEAGNRRPVRDLSARVQVVE